MTTPQQPRPGLPKGVPIILGISGCLLALSVFGIAVGGAGASSCDSMPSWQYNNYGASPESCKRLATRLGISEAETVRRLDRDRDRNRCIASTSTREGEDACKIRYPY